MKAPAQTLILPLVAAFLVSFFGSFSADSLVQYAHAGPAENALESDLQFAFSLKVALSYREAIQKGNTLPFDTSTDDQNAAFLEEGFEKMITTWISGLPKSPAPKPARIQGLKRLFEWKRIYRETLKKTKAFAIKKYKQNGAGYVYCYVIASAVKTAILGYVFWEYGVLAAVVWDNIPATWAVVGGYAGIKNLIHRHAFYKTYGSKAQYLELKQAEQDFYSRLNMMSDRDLFFPLIEADPEKPDSPELKSERALWKNVVIAKESFWTRITNPILNQFGIKPDALTLGALQEFCADQGLITPALTQIWDQHEMSRAHRTAVTLQYLFMNPGVTAWKIEFERRFNSFLRSPNLTPILKGDTDIIVDWAKAAVRAKDLRELRQSLSLLQGSHTHVKGVLSILKSIIFPELADNSPLTRKEFHAISGHRFQKLLAESELSPSLWNDLWSERIDQLFNPDIDPKTPAPSCDQALEST